MSICFDYSVTTPYNPSLYAPIIIRLFVPAHRGFARCLHTFHPMLKGLYFNIHPWLCILWISTYHVHMKNVKFCVHLPLPYVRSSNMSVSVFIPSTQTHAHVWLLTRRLVKTHKKEYMYTNACKSNWSVISCVFPRAFSLVGRACSHKN